MNNTRTQFQQDVPLHLQGWLGIKHSRPGSYLAACCKILLDCLPPTISPHLQRAAAARAAACVARGWARLRAPC